MSLTLKNIQVAAQQNGLEDGQVVAANLTTLDQVATSAATYASLQAQELVNAVNGPSYTIPVTLPDTVQQQGLAVPPPPTPGAYLRTGYERLYVKAVPNPAAQGSVVIYYNNPAWQGSGRLAITAADGRLVWETDLAESSGRTIVDLQGIGKGVYFYSLLQDGRPLVTEKLVILD